MVGINDIKCDFDKAEPRFSAYQMRQRERDLRSELYRAIYAGDMEKAEDAINLMAMIDIDRDLIFQAKAEVRRG